MAISAANTGGAWYILFSTQINFLIMLIGIIAKNILKLDFIKMIKEMLKRRDLMNIRLQLLEIPLVIP
jgi:hypothetical protein